VAPLASTTAAEVLKRRRHSLVVLLTLVTGAADATGFLALGGAFSSVMTGNMVLLGLSAGHTDAALAVTSGSAIISYVVGVLLGAHVAGGAVATDPVWPRQVSRALSVEAVVLLVFLIVWEATPGDRSAGAALALLMIAAVALGIQSSAIQRFGVPGLSSTYLTGTLTTLIGAIAARSPGRSLLPSAQVLTALVVGAGAGALVVEHLPWFSPLLILGPLVLVIGLSRRLHDGAWGGSARAGGPVPGSPQPSRRGAWWQRRTR
jgi:uncharacterized membrane protein YoaK (UPF0700 family)